MSWSTHISAAIADVKSQLETAGYVVVGNRDFVDGSEIGVVCVNVEQASFGGCQEQVTGECRLNILYKHRAADDVELFADVAEIEDVFISYTVAGAVGMRLTGLYNYYQTRTEDRGVAVLEYEIIL